MRFFIQCAYNGKNYVGWQVQPNGLSVQQTLQEALSILLRAEVPVVGAGRTDAGVHAEKMMAHFDWHGDPVNPVVLAKRLNRFLPADISIHQIRPVKEEAHARFSALSRTYQYHVTTEKDPFLNGLRYRIFFNPDVERMNALGAILAQYTDFTSFSRLHTDVKTNNCRVDTAFWEQRDTHYVFTICADRFLRNMVRAIVGTLLDAGRGKLDESGFRRIIEAADRSAAGSSVPGHALFLTDVSYPADIWL